MRIFLPFRPVVIATCAAVFLLVTACWAGITSNLLIEPGKQFALGGGQLGAFRVVAHNVGKVPVEIKERPRGGGNFGKTTLAPGARGTLRFMAGSTALLLNPSAQQARLDLKITGDTRLSMTYEANGKQ
ncbi:hypothetical protein FY528_08390 [Hymenobacter lutimineralis]|uniref:Uncharacterized protein n=1 Tax=Hymenobacter lutimineralis TaxID=2606448 RepID=A0A5D6V5E4_9BACT|nr:MULTISPECIES: hypothetical protein [Hymenobacter]QIX62987.1 hypothetical protein HER32_18140 [Hymenobacter sp. BT18]TYZ10477.1 hypothetical protein FY528_08390 [Hymenobacter lutimineralis]